MGNWTSTDETKAARRAKLPITEEEWAKHEGGKYLILPHYLEDDETADLRAGEEGEESSAGGGSGPRRGPRWSHIEAVLRRKIDDVDQFEKGSSDFYLFNSYKLN
jgi:hypothetical protein